MTKPSKGQRAAQIAIALGKSACYLLLFVGMQVLVQVPVVVLAASAELHGNAARAEELYDWYFGNVTTLTAISGLLTIAIVLIFYLIRRKKLSEALWLRPLPAPALLTGAALAPALYFVVTIALAALPEQWLESYSEASADLGTGGIIGVAAVVLVAPVVEEFIFRGLMTTRLSRAMPGWLAVVLSAALFGLCHGHPVWFGYAFVLGMFFGFIDLRSGSILPSILGHLAFNAIGQVFSLLPDNGGELLPLAVLGVLFILAIVLPILDRPAIAALFRPAPTPPPPPPPTQPGRYDFDPWDN